MSAIEDRIEKAVSSIEASALAIQDFREFTSATWVSTQAYPSKKIMFLDSGTVYSPYEDNYIAGNSIVDDVAAGKLYVLQGLSQLDLASESQALAGVEGVIPDAKMVLHTIKSKGCSRKNYIVNPSMAISQEKGFTGSGSSSAAAFYGVDEWFLSWNAGGGFICQTDGTLGKFRSNKVTAVPAATNLSGIAKALPFVQKIEAQYVYSLNDAIVTIGIDIRTNWTGKLAIAVVNSDSSRSYVTDVDVTSGEQRVYVTLPMESNTILTNDNDTGLKLVVGGCNQGTYRTSTTDSWVVGEFYSSTASTQWVLTTSNYVEITAVKLEEGTVPSAFEPNDYDDDLAECQRYFSVENDVFHTVYADSTTNMFVDHPFKVTMRDTPVVTLTNISDVLGGGASVGVSTVTPSKYASRTVSAAGVSRASFTAKANARL